MTSCTIIVSHYNSLPFLRACIRQIRKYANENVRQEIIICDQSDLPVYNQLMNEFYGQEDLKIVWTKPMYSGAGLDAIFRLMDIKTDYVCEIHADVVPISFAWLKLPVTLIEENDLSFVGQLQCINTKENLANIYPPSPFFAMAQCYNVGKTEIYKELSLKAGFTRFHNRPQTGFAFENNDWNWWAEADYNGRGSDDNIVAFSWQDKYRTDNKLGLAITGFCEPSWGRVIESVVFHFCSCREAANNLHTTPELYQHYTKRINEDYSDELIAEMLKLANENKPPDFEILSRNYWDGELKQHFPASEEINKRIEQLKL